jgi:hypothetical protein
VYEQIEVVYLRDGDAAAVQYAKQTLAVYRSCARPQKNGRKHFAHDSKFRRHFVQAITQLRIYLSTIEK